MPAVVPPDAPTLLGVVLVDEGQPLMGARIRSTFLVGEERIRLPDSVSDGLGRFRVDVSLAVGLPGRVLKRAEVELVVLSKGWVFEDDSVDLDDVLELYGDPEALGEVRWSLLVGRAFPSSEDDQGDLDFFEVGVRGVRLEGRVLDPARVPVEGAVVWLESRDDEGRSGLMDYVEAGPLGQFVMQVEDDDLASYVAVDLCAAVASIGAVRVALDSGALAVSEPFELQLEAAGVVSGWLVSSSGERVAGAHLWIDGAGETEWERPSEADGLIVGDRGEFVFRGLPEGSWELYGLDEVYGPFETGTRGIVLETGSYTVRIEAHAPVPLEHAVLDVWTVGRGAVGWRALEGGGHNEDRLSERAPGVWDVEMFAGQDFAFTVTLYGAWLGGQAPHSWFGSGVVEWESVHSLTSVPVELRPRWESSFELVGFGLGGNGVRGKLLDPESSACVARLEAGRPRPVPSGTYRLVLEAGTWLFGAGDDTLVDVPPGVSSAFQVTALGQGGRLRLRLAREGSRKDARDNPRYDVRLTPPAGGLPVETRWSYSTGCMSGQSFAVTFNGVYISSRAFEPGVWHGELVPCSREGLERLPIEFDVTFVRGETAVIRIELAEDGLSSRVRQL